MERIQRMVRLKAHERDPRRRVRLSNRPETNGKHRRKKRPIFPAATLIPLSLSVKRIRICKISSRTTLSRKRKRKRDRGPIRGPFAMVMDTFNPIATVPSKSWALDNDGAGYIPLDEGRGGSVTMSRNIG